MTVARWLFPGVLAEGWFTSPDTVSEVATRSWPLIKVSWWGRGPSAPSAHSGPRGRLVGPVSAKVGHSPRLRCRVQE
eukprot:3617083-Alexandrium_andersonii.AAC.1